MRHLILGLALLPLTATAGLVVEDEGEKPAVVVAAPAPAQVIIPVEIWKGEQGSTLSDSLQQWANRAKWVVIWDAFKGAEKVDYGLPAPVTFQGTFDSAVAQWIRRYERADIPLVVDIQPDQRVVYITVRKK